MDEFTQEAFNRASAARDFPHSTCPASRHVFMMAEALATSGGYIPLLEDPEHCAGSLFSVVESLWLARKEIEQLKESLDKS